MVINLIGYLKLKFFCASVGQAGNTDLSQLLALTLNLVPRRLTPGSGIQADYQTAAADASWTTPPGTEIQARHFRD
jgi:hypothetical protein